MSTVMSQNMHKLYTQHKHFNKMYAEKVPRYILNATLVEYEIQLQMFYESTEVISKDFTVAGIKNIETSKQLFVSSYVNVYQKAMF